MHTSVVRHNGQLMIDINGEKYPAPAFKSFRPNPKNVSEFHEAGLRLFTALSSGIIRPWHPLFAVRGKLDRSRSVRFCAH